jgi:CheY-like chemotaxis protein
MPSILVVDDSIEIQRLLKELLELEGHSVETASGCDEALELFNSEPVELVITDLCMPDKSGLDIIKSLKSKEATPKIIAISGGPGTTGGRTVYDDMLDSASKLGADFVLPKPFERKDILNSVQEVLKS